MKHADALVNAEDALNLLRPSCERILIAGSVRRQRPEVGDIEIVCIPKHIPAGLFGDVLEVDPDFCAVVNQWPRVRGFPDGKYTQRVLPGGMKLDLFIANPENWGWQLCLRKPRQNIVYVSAERSRPCWTNVTHRIDTRWLSRFEGRLLCTMRLWGLVKRMFPKQGRLHSALM